MHQREVLGDHNISNDELAGLVADLWGVPQVELSESTAEPVAYDVPSILTGSRTWVRGTADAGDGPRAFEFFVKQVHHWRHSTAFDFVPPEIREWAATSVPWRAEVLVYGSDLAELLPEGLTMPRALRIDDRPDETAGLWLEVVDQDDAPWDTATYTKAAHLLGRISGSSRVAPLADPDPLPWHIDYFVAGRLRHTVLNGFDDEDLWRHPAVGDTFGALRERLAEVAGRVEELAAEFAALPHRAAHGDACPNNLLRHVGGGGFTLIDFGFWRPQPVGFDLAQLLCGEIQMRRLDADDLAERADACLAAYAEGLAAEGLAIEPAVLHRSHAVSLMLFNGLPSLPTDALEEEMSDALHHWVAQRAAIASYALDVLSRTE